MILAYAAAPKITLIILGILPRIGYNHPRNSPLTPVCNPR
jgi:hypothetical protein